MIATSKKLRARFNISKMFKPDAGSIPKYFKILETVAFCPAPSPANNAPPTNVCATLTAELVA